MYRIGQQELDAVAGVIKRKQPFRYFDGGTCQQFEQAYAKRLGVRHCALTASGTNALTAALMGLGIGPGDEVIVPACTYMATPIAVLAAGAIPLIVDIDASITIDPAAIEAAIGPRTRAVIPVHMWGLPCDMQAIGEIAERHDLLTVEDACQGVGGAYEGRMLGTFGAAGAFSFNYYKNMTAGEGGAVVTNDDQVAERVRCAVDPCRFYWNGRNESFAGFVANGARSSEFAGALLRVQLERIDDMIAAMRGQKQQILAATQDTGLQPIVANSIDHECGSHVMYTLPDTAAADQFAAATGGTVALKTGRHVYTEWDPILEHRGAHHPAMDPFRMEANRECRMGYDKQMCSRSLDILGRTVFIGTHPDRTEAELEQTIAAIRDAAASVLPGTPAAPGASVQAAASAG